MKPQGWMAGLAIALALASCSSSPRDQAQTPPEQTADQTNSPTAAFPAAPAATAPTKPSTSLPAAVPGLIQSTNASVRVPAIPTRRPDPFAPNEATPLRISLPSQRVSTVVSALPRQLPPLSLQPLPANGSPLPMVPVPATLPPPIAPVSPTAIADAIQVTGAAQVGKKWSVIVKESAAETSRYVSVGDYLANGKVLVKRVITGKGSTPTVVLQQNGKEIMKTVQ